MPPKAFDLLCALARVPGELISKGALLDAVWGHRHVSDSALKSTLSELRAALNDHAREPRFVQTIARRGYRFIAATRQEVAGRSEYQSPLDDRVRASSTHLIRRDGESRRLMNAWSDATAGQRHVVWITGEAGIGKTTLIDHFADEALPTVRASGQCVEQHGAGEPYLPVLAALSELCEQDPTMVELMRTVAPTWLRQLPWLDASASPDGAQGAPKETTQLRMLREFGELIERYSREQALLLITEDLHWSDRATLTLIDHVARRRGPARLLWIASFRLAEVIASDHPVNKLRHELRLHRLADEILIEPFSEWEVGAYLGVRLPDVEIPDSFARAIHTRTDGLPLFVENLVDEIVDSSKRQGGSLDALLAATAAGTSVPENLAGVIEAQLSRLPEGDRVLLDVASVHGVEFSVQVLAAVLDLDATQVANRLDALASRRQWLQPVDSERTLGAVYEARFAFRHALYRHVLYTRCSDAYRRRIHGQIAIALRAARARGHAVTAAELGLHFERSRDLSTAITFYAEATEHALHAFAPSDALAVSDHALPLLEKCAEHEDHLALEIRLLEAHCVAVAQVHGLVCKRTREPYERLSALAELIPDVASSQLDVGFGWSLCAGGQYEQARTESLAKLASAERHGNAMRYAAACNLYGKTVGQMGLVKDACIWLQRGIDAMANTGKDLSEKPIVVDLLVLLHAHLGVFLAHAGAVDQACRSIAVAHARVDEIGHPYSRYRVLNFESAIETLLDRPARVLDIAGAMRRIAEEHAIGQADGLGRAVEGWASMRLGDPVRGYALLNEGHELERRRECLIDSSVMLGRAAQALCEADRAEEAVTILYRAFETTVGIGERLHLPELLMIRAQIARSLGDSSGERTALRSALRASVRQPSAWSALSAATGLCGLASASAVDYSRLARIRSSISEGNDLAKMRNVDEILASR